MTTLEGSPSHPSTSTQMVPAKRKAPPPPAPAPAKRKAAPAPDPARRKAAAAPGGSSGRGLSSVKTKMTTTKPDAEEEEMRQEAATRRPRRVQIPLASSKERLDELPRSLDFKSVSSQEGAKLNDTEIARDLGYDNGGKTIDVLLDKVRTKQSNEGTQLDWLTPTKIGRLQELTIKLGYDNGGKTIDVLLDKLRTKQLDWLMPTKIERLRELTIELGLLKGGQAVDWLLDRASILLGSQAHIHHRQTLHSSPANPPFTVGFSGTYSSPANTPFPAPQFSQNSRHGSFTPTCGLGGGTIPTPTRIGGLELGATIPTPTPTGGGSTPWYHSNPPTSISTPTPVHSSTGPLTVHRSDLPMPNNSFNAFRGGQSQMKGDGQFQGCNNGMFNSSRMMQTMSQKKGTFISTTSMQQMPARSMQQMPLHRQINQLPERIRKLENDSHSQAMQLPVQNGGTASNPVFLMSDWTPNASPAQDILNQVQAPAYHIPTERKVEGHNPNQLAHSHCNNGGQSPSIQTETKKKQQKVVNGKIETQTKKKQQKVVNGKVETQTKKKHLEVNESLNIKTEAQTEQEQLQQEVTEFLNSKFETQPDKQHDVITVIAETEGLQDRQDGGRNEGSPGAAEATKKQASEQRHKPS